MGLWRKRTSRTGLIAAFLFGLALLALAMPVHTTPAEANQTLGRAAPVTPGKDEVLVGAYIENIQAVDPSTNSFLADFYVWYRWKNPDFHPKKSVEIMNWYEAWQMMELGHQQKPRSQPDGSYYYAQRYTGAFNSPLSLVKFPFGVQRLDIVLEDFDFETAQMRFIPDTKSTAIDPTITLPGYDIGKPTISIKDFSYPTDFGDLDTTSTEVYSRATISTPVSNPGLTNVIKYLLPILLIVGAASLVFYLPPDAIEGRIALGITALLTLVAMQWSATEGLPTVAYLTMLDVLYLLGIMSILASLILGIRGSWIARESGEATAIHSDNRMLFVFLGVFAAAFAAVLVFYLAF